LLEQSEPLICPPIPAANDNGCTPIDHPGFRWSGYVYKLRKVGVVIETFRETHAGPVAGQHARYALRSLIIILEEKGGKSRWRLPA
jgi:hypothetical protein